MIKVSIITTCLNSSETISRTMKSVLNQSYQNIEYVIIDANSSDNTLCIVKSFENHFLRKSIPLIVRSEPDNGIYEGMNKGICTASGELIGIINSDDWYEYDAVETAVNKYIDNNNAVIYGMLKIYKNDKLYQIRQNTHYFIWENMFQHPTWFVPRSIYDKYGLYEDIYRVGGDYEMANRLLSKGVEFVRIEKVMTHFSLGGASSQLADGGQEWNEIRKRYGHFNLKYTSSSKNKNNKLKILISEIIRSIKKFFR